MSFAKALDLLRLADMASGRYAGVTLEEICAEFGVHTRTAQRMTRALEQQFPHAIDVTTGEDRKRRWALRDAPLAHLRLQGAEELEALEASITALHDRGDDRQASALAGLRDRLLAALPARAARSAEADADAMLEAHGVAARPGPRVIVGREVSDAVAQALKGPYRLLFAYGGTAREVEPMGILTGARRYLVARDLAAPDTLRHFRLDLIRDVVTTETLFHRDPDFTLEAHCARAFGSFHNAGEYGEVVWRFAPSAAARAREWQFHPDQRLTDLPDGGLEVRFAASGWLEMAWHLLSWGDAVEVLYPPELRALLANPDRNGDVLP